MGTREFRYSRTVLNAAVLIGLLANAIFTLLNWEQLSGGEGWGVLAVIVIAIFTLSGLIVDLILQFIFRDKKILNIIGGIVVVIYIIIVLS